MGRTGGGVFNTTLKSGSNELHGSLVGYTRQTDWLREWVLPERQWNAPVGNSFLQLRWIYWRAGDRSKTLQRAEQDVFLGDGRRLSAELPV